MAKNRLTKNELRGYEVYSKFDLVAMILDISPDKSYSEKKTYLWNRSNEELKKILKHEAKRYERQTRK